MAQEFTQVRANGTVCSKYELFSGKGKMEHAIGSYEGEFKNGELNGYGKLKYRNGSVYTGEFKNNMQYGLGTMIHKSGVSYTGNFKDNMFDGEGIYKFGDGISFHIGNMKEDFFKGQGKRVYKNYDIFEGEWDNDKRNGIGKMYVKKTGVVTTGVWKDDKLVETISTTYNVLTVTRPVFHEHCVDAISLEKWVDAENPDKQIYKPGVLVVLHNPDDPKDPSKKLFDVSKPVDDAKLCNFMQLKESYDNGNGKNPFTGVKMLEKDIDIYILSIESPKHKSPAKSPVKSPAKSPVKSPAKSPAKSPSKSLKSQSLRLKSISKKNSSRKAKSI
jgi:hypothetical protein